MPNKFIKDIKDIKTTPEKPKAWFSVVSSNINLCQIFVPFDGENTKSLAYVKVLRRTECVWGLLVKDHILTKL